MLRGGVRRVEWEMGGFPGTANSRTARGIHRRAPDSCYDEGDAQSVPPTQSLQRFGRTVGLMEAKRKIPGEGCQLPYTK
jgi:hypothetical protein